MKPIAPAAILIALTFAASVPAQDAAPAPESVETLVRQLDAESFEQREAATTELMLRADLDDTQLARFLRTAADSPERRHRLVRIAMHRYFARLEARGDGFPLALEQIPPGGGPAPHAAGCIGIDIHRRNVVRPDQVPALKHPALLITSTRVGFPAYALLRPGDMVLSFEGKRIGAELEDDQALVNLIKQSRAGQVVRLVVMRNGKEVPIEMRLDSLERLQGVSLMLGNTGNPESFGPWVAHLRNMAGGEAGPTPVPLDPTDDRPARQRGKANGAVGGESDS